ncbi:head-tail connector protein [Thermoanaerobacterium thermosaccharolyticum]|uniref:head-tail connector protein n=1 Tax=Thermoanaerobacterium thermosaccharolyticum TaxID=1517 RepID=UPI003DA7FEA2
MYQQLVTPPAMEPVTLEEAKLHLRIDGNEEDSLISALIMAARQKCEEYTRRAFITQTWELALDSASGKVYLPRPPIQTINEVTLDGKIVSAENYSLIGQDAFYPKISLNAVNPAGLVIRYISGYGSNAADVPQAIRQAILMLVAHLYEAREGEAPQVEYEVQARAGADIPPMVTSLLRSYRVMML